jgi:hypothetical protein
VASSPSIAAPAVPTVLEFSASVLFFVDVAIVPVAAAVVVVVVVVVSSVGSGVGSGVGAGVGQLPPDSMSTLSEHLPPS